jgi:hypothetical protein
VYIRERKPPPLALVTVRVPEGLKKQMRKLKSVNWSELLRQAIEDRVELEQRSMKKDWERVREGSRKADAIRNEIEREYGFVDFNSAETIRYWREMRSRGTSRTPQ